LVPPYPDAVLVVEPDDDDEVEEEEEELELEYDDGGEYDVVVLGREDRLKSQLAVAPVATPDQNPGPDEAAGGGGGAIYGAWYPYAYEGGGTAAPKELYAGDEYADAPAATGVDHDENPLQQAKREPRITKMAKM
jgi:hypothetical protein